MSTKKNPTCCGTTMNSLIRFDAAILWQCNKCHCILTQAGEKYRPWKKDEVPTACIMKPDCGSGSKFNISPTDEKMWGSFDVCHIEGRGSVPTINILKFFTMMDGSPCGVKITSKTKEKDVKSKSNAKKSYKDEHIGELTASLKIVTRQREEALHSLEKVEQVLAEEQARTDKLQREAVSLRRDLEEMTKNRDGFHQQCRGQMATITQMQKQESSFAAQKGALEEVIADLKAKNREIEARLGQTRATLLGQLRGMEKVLFDCTRATPVKPIVVDDRELVPMTHLTNTSRDGRCLTCGCMTENVNGKNVCPHCHEPNKTCPFCGQRRYWTWSNENENTGKWFCNIKAHNYPEPAVKETPQHPCAEKAACKQSSSPSESVTTGKVCADCGSYMGRLSKDKWYCYNKVCPSYADKSREKEAQSQHPFSGKKKCEKCGYPMAWVSPGKWHCDNTACSSHVGKCFGCGVAIGEKANLQYRVVDGDAYCAYCMTLKYGKKIPLTYPTKNNKASDKGYIYCALCGSRNRYTVLDGRVECACCLPYPLKGEGKSFEEARAELQNNTNVAKAKEEKPTQPLPTAQVWTASDGPLQYRPWRMGEIPKMFYATPSGNHSGYASWWYKYDGEAWTEDMGRTTIVKLRSNKNGDITISTEELLKHFHGEQSNPILGVKLENPPQPPKEEKTAKEAVTDKYAANRGAIKMITNKTAMALAGAVIFHAIRDNNSAKAYYVKQCRDWAKRNHKSFEKVFGAALANIA